MKILIYNIDSGGIKKYSEYLAGAMKKQGFGVIMSDKIGDLNFDIIHVQFEHALFHPFGLRLIPLLIKLKIHGKKIVITNHTILSRKEIYARNKFFRFIKKFLFPLDEILMGLLADKIIVHTDHAKKILINDYKIKNEKVEVVPIGIY